MLTQSSVNIPLCLVLKEVGACQLNITSCTKFLPQKSNKESASPSQL